MKEQTAPSCACLSLLISWRANILLRSPSVNMVKRCNRLMLGCLSIFTRVSRSSLPTSYRWTKLATHRHKRTTTLFVQSVLSCNVWPCNHFMYVIAKETGLSPLGRTCSLTFATSTETLANVHLDGCSGCVARAIFVFTSGAKNFTNRELCFVSAICNFPTRFLVL